MMSLQGHIRWCVRAQAWLGGALAALLLAFLLLDYLPATRRQQALDNQNLAKQRELNENREKSRDLNKIVAEVRTLRERLDGSKKLPDHMDLAGFLADITQLSQQTSLKNVNCKPGVVPK